MGPGWIELTTPGSAVRLASVARHVTDCATRPGRLLPALKNTSDRLELSISVVATHSLRFTE